MPLGNWEGGRCCETKSEYLPDVLCKELRITANCVDPMGMSPFFAQRAKRKEHFL